MALAAIPLGLLIGLSVGVLGGGGSVLAVPVLVYLLGEPVGQATTASLMVVTAGALAGGLGHHREGRVCWRHAAVFTAGAVPGVFAGTTAGGAVGGALLLALFAAVMLLAAAATWRRASSGADGAPVPGRTCPPLHLARDLAAGAGIGFLTGLLGVGGGFLIVPTLAVALAFTLRSAIGTSLAIIAATSLLGLGAHLLAGRTVDLAVAGTMTVACAAGALAGARVSGRLPRRELGRGFALLVTAVAAYLIVADVLLGGPPGG